MKFTKFDVYHKDYSLSFFQSHSLQPGVKRSELVSAQTPKPRFGQTWFGSKPAKIPQPTDSQDALRRHITDTIESRSPEQILKAAKNVARFNEGHGDLSPLAHPALQLPKPGLDAVKQLTFELRTIEQQYQSRREQHAVDVQSWPGFLSDGKIAPYQRRIKAVLIEQVPTMQEKYRHVSLIAKASLTAAETAHALVKNHPEGNKAFTPAQRDALRGLFNEVKKSLAVAKSDLESIHEMYDRAQAAVLQLVPADVQRLKASKSAPVQIDNLLGPGQIQANATATARELRGLVQEFLKTLGDLENPVLRHRISELTAAQTVLGQALRGTQIRAFLGERFDGGKK